MAHADHGPAYPFVAASQLKFGVAVKADTTVAEQVLPAASTNDEIVGITIATVPTYGAPVAIVRSGVAKAIAAASTGHMARVGVASTDGSFGPISASAAGASGVAIALRYSMGWALKAAAAGEVFPVLLDPRQIV